MSSLSLLKGIPRFSLFSGPIALGKSTSVIGSIQFHVKASHSSLHQDPHGHHDVSGENLHRSNPDKYDSHGVEYTERPNPWGIPKGKRMPKDKKLREFQIFYIGGTIIFLILLRYKPDTSMQTWATREAWKRMKARGIDMSDIAIPKFI